MEEKRIRLLLVEDDKVDQMAFERFVREESLPYDYTATRSISAAEEVLKSQEYDVVISDYMLGDGTAFDIFDQTKDAPIIVVTGTGNEEVAVTAMKQGAYDYIMKDPEGNYLKTLPSTVELALKRKQTEKELRNYQERLEFMVKERTAQLEAEIVVHKQAEDALRESEERYREILENVLVGVYQVTLDGKPIFANQKMTEMFDYTSSEELIATSNFAELYARPEERLKIVDEIINKGFHCCPVNFSL